jgi:hypothetical protein
MRIFPVEVLENQARDPISLGGNEIRRMAGEKDFSDEEKSPQNSNRTHHVNCNWEPVFVPNFAHCSEYMGAVS